MIARRVLGIAMMAVQAELLRLRMGWLGLSGATILIALIGCWPALQRDWPRKKQYMADGIVVFSYAVWWWLYLQHDTQVSQQYQPNMSLAGALGLMMLQAIRFYWRNPSGLTLVFPFLGILSLACAADVYIPDGTHRNIFFWGAMLYGALVAVFYECLKSTRKLEKNTYPIYRYGALAICLLMSLGLAAGTAGVLSRSDRLIGSWLLKSMTEMQRVGLGNSSNVQLGSMADLDGSQADHIALQIVAPESPGYLRGQAYATYGKAWWGALSRDVNVGPWTDAPPAPYEPAGPWEQLFAIAPGNPVSGGMTIYPGNLIRTAMFTPEHTGWVALATDAVLTNKAHIVEADQDLKGGAYQVLRVQPPAPAPLEAAEHTLYTQVPEELAPRISELSASVCGGRDTPAGKALAVAQYFTSNYDYALDFRADGPGDPVEQFLFASPHPAAHCEYFATGATLLLRAAGVPARYVTGVAVWEQHPFSSHWIARNRDAHAWCEAWDAEMGWFVVEATPAGGLPEAARGDGANRIRDFFSMLSLQFRRLVAAVRQGAWAAAGGVVTAMVMGIARFVRDLWWLALALVLAAVAVWRLRVYFRSRVFRSPATTGTELERQLVHQLRSMDRFLARKHRLARPAHWTPHHFARRIEEELGTAADPGRLAAWYRSWAETRYRPACDPSRVEGLDRELHDLRGRHSRADGHGKGAP